MKPNEESLTAWLASVNESLAALELTQNPAEIQAINQRLTDLESQIDSQLEENGDPESDDEIGEFLSEIERKRQKTVESQEIGPLPDPKDIDRRESCRFDLRRYVLTYFAASCWKGLSPYQEEMIAAFQHVILRGGKKARAVRRSGLKSTLARIATAWAIVYGHRRYVVLAGATATASHRLREQFIEMLVESKLHTKDFPELLPLFFKHENPKKGVVLNGVEQLDVTTKDSRGCIVFPRYDDMDQHHGKDLSQAQIAPYSIQTSGVRGLSREAAGGGSVRPDLLVFDDVQSDMAAASVPLTDKLENKINTTFMGLVGLGQTIAAIMVCTVAREDDLSLRFCDRKRHPDWDGRTFPVLTKEPTGIDCKNHWAKYKDLLLSGATIEEGQELATGYYVEHRVAMDSDGMAAWENDKDPGFVSSLQWAMQVSLVNPDFYRCELQQKGAKPKGDITQLSATQLLRRMSGIQRGVVPSRATYLTGFVDSQDHYLFWMVCAWMSDMTGWIVDWGAWPDQNRHHFHKHSIGRTLEDELPGVSWEEAFVNAHNQLDMALLTRRWPIEGDNGTKSIDLLLKDWANETKLVGNQVMSSPFIDRIRPARGFDVKPGGKPIHKYGDATRDRHCSGCWIERRTERPYHVQVDTDMAKGMVARRLQTIVGAPSSVIFPGDDENEVMMLVEHFTAEKALDRSLSGVHGTHYDLIPGRDNEGWDCLTGNLVAASMLGCAVPGETAIAAKRKGPRRTLAEIMKQPA